MGAGLLSVNRAGVGGTCCQTSLSCRFFVMERLTFDVAERGVSLLWNWSIAVDNLLHWSTLSCFLAEQTARYRCWVRSIRNLWICNPPSLCSTVVLTSQVQEKSRPWELDVRSRKNPGADRQPADPVWARFGALQLCYLLCKSHLLQKSFTCWMFFIYWEK